MRVFHMTYYTTLLYQVNHALARRLRRLFIGKLPIILSAIINLEPISPYLPKKGQQIDNDWHLLQMFFEILH